MIFRNPTVNMEGARTEKRLPVHLTLKQSKQLLSNIINSDDRNKIRNYTITCIFLNCGLRLSELVGINLSNIKIDDSEQTVKILGKGNKERILYLDAAVCEAIKAYLVDNDTKKLRTTFFEVRSIFKNLFNNKID